MSTTLRLRRLLGRRRVFAAFLIVVLTSVFYLGYQMLSIGRLGEELSSSHNVQSRTGDNGAQQDLLLDRSKSNEQSLQHHGIRIKGVRADDVKLYIPSSRGNFRCIHSREEITYHKVNDDYCDCEDGSDEPSTPACPNGRFYCTSVIQYKNEVKFIPSSRVNDGICDCCDGGDEWANQHVPMHVRVDETVQKKTNVYQTPCSDRCAKN